MTRAPPQPAVAVIAPSPATAAAITGQTLRAAIPRAARIRAAIPRAATRADIPRSGTPRDNARDTDNPPCSTVFGGCLVYIACRRDRTADSPELRLTGQWSKPFPLS
ncbi:hypothetical protein Misp03_31620 [Microbispora sp. NBRC 16548]|nr:hypothetical protein Misp03_31620 [Microbispora sp. NBRC 16548]